MENMESVTVQVDETPRKYPWNLVPKTKDKQESAKVEIMSQKWAAIEDTSRKPRGHSKSGVKSMIIREALFVWSWQYA